MKTEAFHLKSEFLTNILPRNTGKLSLTVNKGLS